MPHTALWLARNRRIWGAARQIGMAEGDLRYLVAQAVGMEGEHNISRLTEVQQIQVLGTLQLLQGQTYQKRREQKKRLDPPPKGNRGAVSWRQIELLRKLASQLGWGDGALRAWLRRWHRVDHEKWLTASKAGRAIQGLKAIISREKANAQSGV